MLSLAAKIAAHKVVCHILLMSASAGLDIATSQMRQNRQLNMPPAGWYYLNRYDGLEHTSSGPPHEVWSRWELGYRPGAARMAVSFAIPIAISAYAMHRHWHENIATGASWGITGSHIAGSVNNLVTMPARREAIEWRSPGGVLEPIGGR